MIIITFYSLIFFLIYKKFNYFYKNRTMSTKVQNVRIVVTNVYFLFSDFSSSYSKNSNSENTLHSSRVTHQKQCAPTNILTVFISCDPYTTCTKYTFIKSKNCHSKTEHHKWCQRWPLSWRLLDLCKGHCAVYKITFQPKKSFRLLIQEILLASTGNWSLYDILVNGSDFTEFIGLTVCKNGGVWANFCSLRLSDYWLFCRLTMASMSRSQSCVTKWRTHNTDSCVQVHIKYLIW